jgi:amidase
MGRSVRDVALLLSVIAGPDHRAPNALDEDGAIFRGALERDFKSVRIAWSEDLGKFPVEPVIVEGLRAVKPVFAELGCEIEDAAPDLAGVERCYQVLRAWAFALQHAHELESHRDKMKSTVVWNTEEGLALSALEVARAEVKRAEIARKVGAFLERYEFLVLPVTQVPPFSVEEEWVREVAGVKMESYIDWMAICWAITVTGLPAISVPCGFTPDGLPIGVQIVGRHHRDLDVLKLAYAFERSTAAGKRRPPICQSAK